MEGISQKASLASQGAWLILARVVGFAFAFILPLVIVRRLSQEAVGVYRQSFQLAGDAAAILSFGLNLSAFYYFNREPSRRASAALNILIFNFASGALAFLFLIIYPEILRDLFQTDALTPLAPKIGILIWAWLFSSFVEFAAVANQESRIGSLFIMGTQFTKAVLMLAAVVWFETVDAIITAALIQCVLQSLLLLVYLNSRFPRFWRSFDLGFFKEQAFYAIPFGVVGLLWIVQNSLHFYFVGHAFTEAEYAIYAYGCFQLPLVAILAESIASVMLPRMSELQMKGDYAGMKELIVRATEKLSFYYFAIYAYLIGVADVFVTTLFTSDYAASTPIFVAYLTLLPLNIWLVDPIFRSFESFGRQLVVMRIVFLSVLIASLAYAVRSFPLQGIILVVVAVGVVDRLICVLVAARRIGLPFRELVLPAGVMKTAVTAIFAGGISYFAGLVFRDYVPFALSTSFLDLSAPAGGRLGEFVVGSAILASTLVVFLIAYLLIAHLFGIIDDREKRIFARSWRFIARYQ
jgi:O-antigen/teichoic acid export membrane protein